MQFCFTDHVLDRDRRELRRGADAIALEPQVFDLLVYLLESRDHVVTKDELIDSVWGGRIVSESTLTSRINAARKAVQSNPAHSISYMLLAAALVKLGRLEEAKAAAARVLELQPAFRYSRQFAGVDCAPALAASLSEALRAAGLPE